MADIEVIKTPCVVVETRGIKCEVKNQLLSLAWKPTPTSALQKLNNQTLSEAKALRQVLTIAIECMESESQSSASLAGD